MLLAKCFVIVFTTTIRFSAVIRSFVCYLYVLFLVVSMACVLLGSKIEEELIQISKIIKVFYRMYQRRIGEDVRDLTETDSVEFGYTIYKRFSLDGEVFFLILRNYFSLCLDIISMVLLILHIATFSFLLRYLDLIGILLRNWVEMKS